MGRKKTLEKEFLEKNEKARKEFEKIAKEIKEEEKKKIEKDYKQNCRFYDRERKRCIALKKVYCDVEEKMCVFFKERE